MEIKILKTCKICVEDEISDNIYFRYELGISNSLTKLLSVNVFCKFWAALKKVVSYVCIKPYIAYC